ncbi:hypothetical protein FC90_GL001156 [Latilactobacillus graminis DSM 20719]|uniref:DUF3324 domain-containing protein n=1 Tax=Latilactobacillus graminis DSM 20719 TaxID=1423752 RepID=A0AA89I8P5_9LACO|nr:hypothetical protein FC90_GL001156 [Latilactobacillus graminis DSM 20719]
MISLITTTTTSQAAEPAASFAMTIVPPENQTNQNLSYFDLVVKPNQTYNLKLKLVNHQDTPTKIALTAKTATTNMNGVVNYGAHQDQSDKTLKYALGDYLKPEAKRIKLNPQEQRVVDVTLKTPPKAFKGQLVGGISAVELPKSPKTSQQINIRNKFAYAVAVVIRTNQQTITPEFKLGQVAANQMMGSNQILANIRNVQPKFQNQTTIKAFVTKRGQKKKLYQTEKKQVQFAPNSVMPFYLPLNGPFKPGRYTLDLTVHSEGRQWHFTRHFTVSRQAANQWNAKDVNLPPQNNYWPYVLTGILLILIILGYVYWRYRKKQQENKALKDELNRLKS